ncbi:dinitrogenase iron-molybdenum cofactor biosynthesis protein [Leptolyngbya sp. Heron Island J]|uniref:dinitrogenase iron-molybdenum cofactor biosynthesis protein n=1 Tax=Leptolyngbya sp. Heron Island J TaxID=1385935 RepID=UPI0003B9C3D1|nr:dinitrogenase iron-molybdenum cofactor biosynthesis protein [Leptolyngbya sp. Heron Island J]ESA34622.1 dinitrogenase iron-molybdenum cofactor biosynthesis protein [Leptolyngbya sp. Heron Island J]
MTDQPISNEVALRIALAARALPDVSVPELIGALQTNLDDNISEESLSTLTVTQLKRSFGNIYAVDEGEWEGEDANNQDIAAFKAAIRILWGEQEECEHPLPIEPYQEGDMPNSIRVAVASNTAEQLDGHFGSCHRYLIYQLSADDLKLIDVRSALEADLSDNKNQFRVNLIKDCPVLYVVSIGGPAAAQVIQANIYPMKIETGGEIRPILADLQTAIANSPPPWLAKILGIAADKRVKNYHA